MSASRMLPGRFSYRSRSNRKSAQLYAACESLERRTLLSAAPLFLPHVDYTVGGGHPSDAVIGDITGDGIPDIVTIDTAGKISILQGNGDGTFKPATRVSDGAPVNSQASAIVGRFISSNSDNNDKSGLLIFDDTNTVELISSNGDGTLAVTSMNFSHPVYSAASGDFNGDGNADLAVGYSNGQVATFIQGYSGLNPGGVYSVASGPISQLQTIDLNDSGLQSLVAVDKAGQNIDVLMANGPGTFIPTPISVFHSSDPRFGFGIDDFNGDGFQDIGVGEKSGYTVALLSNGNGQFHKGLVNNFPSGTYGAAIGDFTGDGKPDLVFGDVNKVDFFAGNGDGTFAPVVSYSAGNSPQYVLNADLNGDGQSDLVTVNYASDSVSVLLHSTPSGGTSFQSPATLPAGNKPRAVALGDLNNDGIPDMVVADQSDNAISIFLGNGDGTFQPANVISGFSRPYSVAISTLVSGGHPDILVADSGTNSISILQGNGNGTFQAATTLFVGTTQGNYGNSMTLATGDFNGDGIPDILTTFANTDTVSVLLGNGDATFKAAQAYQTGSYPSAVAIADINGDGNLDFAVSDRYSASVQFFFGNGHGSFVSNGTVKVGDRPSSIVFGDFNGDGLTDMAVADAGNYDNPGQTATVAVLLAIGPGAMFGAPKVIDLPGNGAGTVVAADFNGDGKTDLAIATGYNSGGADQVNFLNGNGDGTFLPRFTYNVTQAPEDMVVGDLNRDGKPDVVVIDSRTAEVSVLINTSSGLFFKPDGNIATASQSKAIATGDFNKDGHQDIVVVGSSISIYFGNGVGTFSVPTVYHTSATNIIVGDINSDGNPDIICTNSQTHSILVLLGNGNGTFKPVKTTTVAGNISFAAGAGPALADFTGDGKPDLVVPYFPDGGFALLVGNNDGTFQPSPRTFGSNNPANSVAAANLNGDSHPDLVFIDTLGNVDTFINNGSGGFTISQQLPVGTSTTANSVSVADLNGDTHPDIVTANNNGTASVLINNGNGTFGAATQFMIGGNPAFAVLSDINGDGKQDIVAIDAENGSYSVGEVHVLLGNGDGTFGPPIAAAPVGFSQGNLGLAVVDFNDDGNPDIAEFNSTANRVSIFLRNAPAKITTSGSAVTATGSGSDSAAVTYSAGQLILNLDGQSETFAANSTITIHLGTGNGNVMLGAGVPAVSVKGSGGNDTIMAMNSAGDTVNGGGGQDFVEGTGANQALFGGAGNDTVLGMGESSSLQGGAGIDMLIANAKKDTVVGGGGNDTIAVSQGHDSLRGGPGDNLFINGSGKKDTIDGGAGGLSFAQNNPNDVMTNIFEVFDPTPPVSSSPANAPARVAAAAANLAAAAAVSVTASLQGTELLVVGTNGADTISVGLDGSGASLQVSSAGTVISSFPLVDVAGIRINGEPTGDSISVDPDVLVPATLLGGGGPDTLVGGGSDNVLIGGGNSDSLVGGAGTNLLIGELRNNFVDGPLGHGSDTIDGGSGYSIADFSHREDDLHLIDDGQPDSGNLTTSERDQINSNISAIWGGTGNDTITVVNPSQFISGGSGNDSISTGGASDIAVGGVGSDSVRVNAEPVALYLQDGLPDQYSGIANPLSDIIEFDAGLDSLMG